MEALLAHVPHTSQNLRVDSVNEQYFVHFALIQPTKAQVTMDPTTKKPSDDRSTSRMDYDKWVTLEERWKTVERNNLINPILAAEVCLVQKNYGFKGVPSVRHHQVHQARTPEHPSPIYYNKMAKVIHNDKMLIYFFQDSLIGSILS